MAEHPEDRYANIAGVELTMSAANTMSFVELRTGIGMQADRKTAVGMLIDEIDYSPKQKVFNDMNATGDRLSVGITVSNQVTDLEDVTDKRILHSANIYRLDGGTAGNFVIQVVPLVYQFFPAIIHAERAVFLAADSLGLADPEVIRMRMYYRTVTLTDGEFIELSEVFRLVG